MLTGSVVKTWAGVVTAGESATPSSEFASNISRTRSTSSKAAHSERRSQPCWAPTIWRSPDLRSDSISTLSGRWAIIGINYFAVLSQSIYRPKTIVVSLVADLEGTPPSFYWSSPLSRDLARIKRWWRWWLSMIKWSGWDKSGDQSGPVRVKETIPPLQLSYPVPVNRLTPDNKMKALTGRRLSIMLPGRDRVCFSSWAQW